MSRPAPGGHRPAAQLLRCFTSDVPSMRLSTSKVFGPHSTSRILGLSPVPSLTRQSPLCASNAPLVLPAVVGAVVGSVVGSDEGPVVGVAPVLVAADGLAAGLPDFWVTR